MIKNNLILAVVVTAIIGSIFYLESSKPKRVSVENADIVIPADESVGKSDEDVSMSANSNDTVSVNRTDDSAKRKAEKSAKYPLAKEMVDVQGFVNSNPFKIADFIGKKIIMVDFWTYSCINCQRTTPYLNAWWDKYEDDGLLIIGVHTPEFDFEKKYENVSQAVKNFGIKYPVVQDNNYGTWTAYGNRYWPRKYLIDIDGYIVYDHVGEGGYEETEAKIRELLIEKKSVLGEVGNIENGMVKPENVQDVSIKPESPEVYFGAFRNTLLANGKQSVIGIQNFMRPENVSLNSLYLSGTWDIQKEYAQSGADSSVIFKFKARRVNIVAEAERSSKIRVFLDGKEIKEISVDKSQLYELVDLPDQGEHLLELIPENPGIRVYTFTFG